MRQGSVISPKLFALYVYVLTQSLIKSKIGCILDGLHISSSSIVYSTVPHDKV